jgi:hypothetical protein
METEIRAQVESERRMFRGREIASHPDTIEKISETEWSVPSQTSLGRYLVSMREGVFRCGCKDFAGRRGEPCKHIFAVRDLVPQEVGGSTPAPTRKVRKQYPQHATYTKAQTEEMRLLDSLLRDLVADLPDLPKAVEKGGRPAIPLSDALYCAILKVYSGLSGRRACGVYENVSDRHLLEDVPSYNVASRALNRPETTAILYRLLQLSASPLAGLEEGGAVAPDSTGVQTTSFGGWREEKHGEKRQKKWLKVHAIVGTRTHVIMRAIVSEENTGDSPEFGPLLRGALEGGFHPSRVVADMGYMSAENYALADKLGVEPIIPFRSGTVSNEVNRIRRVVKPASWVKAYHLFQASRVEFDRRYHVRSNVESVFSALKRKFGEHVRSRAGVAQVNEILAKLICYNLTVVVHEMFENGIAPAFVNQNSGA